MWFIIANSSAERERQFDCTGTSDKLIGPVFPIHLSTCNRHQEPLVRLSLISHTFAYHRTRGEFVS